MPDTLLAAQAGLARRDLAPFGTMFRALLRRELRRYVVDAVESVCAPVFSAMIYLLVFLAALGPERATAEGTELLNHLVPGLVMMNVMLQAFGTPAFSLTWERMEGSISDVLTSPMGAGEMAAAYAVAGALSGMASGVLTWMVLSLLWPVMPPAPLLALVFAFLSGLMLALLGILTGLWADKWDHFAAAFGLLMIPLVSLSGVFMPLAALPPPLDTLVLAFPVAWSVGAFRAGMLEGPAEVPPLVALLVVLATIGLLWLAVRHLIGRGWKLRA